MTPEQRRLRARIGGLAAYAKHGAAIQQRATAAFLARFVNEVDPDHQLDEDERQRRALAARRAYFAGLALKSSMARRRSAAA